MKQYKSALKHFQKVDPVLYQTAMRYDPLLLFEVSQSINYFERLCRAIAGQQLSTKAAATIWQRFVESLHNSQVLPENVLSLDHEHLRQVGLSNAKARYIRGIAEAVVNQMIDLDGLDQLSDLEVIQELTKLKGVGVWTAEMFLMFTLHREDLFSVGDLGLRRAIEKLYQLDNPSNEDLLKLSQKWSPYRTYACRILWESLDNNPQV